MKKIRKAFSFLEVLLVIVILGLLAAVIIPASVKISQKARYDVISQNIDKVIEAGKIYNSERGTKSVDYKTLVEAKFLPNFQSVSGESYDALKIESNGGIAGVTTSMGEKVEKTY